MSNRRTFKRILVIADLHSGHIVGLTPPAWWFSEGRSASNAPSSVPNTQRRLWGAYCEALNDLRPIDVLIVNGDCIDGKGPRSGATELITADREEQCRMAVQCIEQVRAKNIVLTYGTAYHSGQGDDWENIIAKTVDAKIGSHEWVTVNGTTFDVKHHVGTSTIPHGRGTPIARERLWNMIWAEREEQPKGDVVIRSHTHYHAYTGAPGWLAMTTPALQAAGTKYGARRCSGTVDLGLVYFDCYPGGRYTWRMIPFPGAIRKAKATTF